MSNCAVHVTEERSPATEADTIILLHAGGSSGDQWRGVQRSLGKRYHLAVPDLYGDGRSNGALPAKAADLLAAEVALVRAVAEGAGGRAHLVGHSYGGLAALRTALAHPEIVQSLVLFEPIVFDLARREVCAPVFCELDTVWRDCDEAVAAGDFEGAAKRFVDYWDEDEAYVGLPAQTQAQIASAMPKVTRGWRAIVDNPVDYTRVGVPTTVIEAALSPAPARWMSRRICECVQGARLVHLEGVGHLAPVTHPALVAREIGRHMSSFS